MIGWNLAFILILIALNGFFVGVEFAAVASRRARLENLAPENSRSLKIVKSWLENTGARDHLIAASQLGITLVSLVLGAVGENTFHEILAPVFHTIQVPLAFEFINAILSVVPLVLSLTLITAMHVILGEQVPKVAILRSPEQFALAAAPFMQIFIKIFKGFINLLDGCARLILKLIGLTSSGVYSAEKEFPSVYTLDEIRLIVAGPETEAVLEQPERDMLSAVIDFGELVVRQVSVPRTEIVAVEGNLPLAEIVPLVTQHPFTKFPVYEDNLDQILGILHVRDVINAMRDPSSEGVSARSLAREALFVPENISVNDLLLQFRTRRTHIAIVLDEFGGTAGLVTLENLLERIVGEFRDPFDAAPPTIQVLPDGSTMVDGLTTIDEVNDHLGLDLRDPDYDTIAGYMLGKLGRIPQVGDSVTDPGNHFRLKVEAMDRLRIARLSFTRLDQKHAEGGTAVSGGEPTGFTPASTPSETGDTGSAG
jgi:putative hemolysin